MKKMSKSDPEGSILISDTDEEIRRKVDNAWCPVPNICEHCDQDIALRNPSGFCDHLYYPDYCKICKK